MKKKVLFAAVMLMVMALVTKAWAYDFSYTYQGQTLYYNIVDGTAEVTFQQQDYINGFYDNLSGAVAIPASVSFGGTTYAVTSIGNWAFYNCSGLASVTIPNSVTSIGNYSFGWCSGLTSVTMPSNITAIGNYAFASCSGLTSVTIPSSVTTIGDYSFGNVRHIEYYGSATGSPWGAISMNGVTEGGFVYSDNTKHKLLAYIGSNSTVTIPSTVDTIGNQAFYLCTGLTSVTIPNSVTFIGNYAFYGDSNLVNIAIPSTVDYIGISAFSYCSSLTSVNLPEGLTIINGWAFFHCSSLTSIVIPDNVTIIDTSAFSECYNLTSITFGSNVETINDWAFSLCGMTSLTIPQTVTYIGDYAFAGVHLQSITIPENVTHLGSYSFGTTDTVYLLSQSPSDYQRPTDQGIIVVPCSWRAFYMNAWSVWGDIGQHIYDPCIQAGTFTLINHGGGYFAYVDFTQYDDNGYNVQVIVSDTTILVSETPVTQALLFASFANDSYGYTPNLARITYNGTEIDLSSITSADYGEYVMYQYNTGLPGVYEAWFGDAGEPEEYNVIVMSSDESLGEVESYYDGESAYAYAYAYGGAVFNGWSNGSMENPLTLTVTSDTTLIALFSSASAAVTDTLWMHDTTTVVDTVTLTEYVPVHDTTYINVHDTSYIVLTDTLTVTLYDTIINTVFDTIDNYIYDTTIVTDTLWLTQYDTITNTVFDTVDNYIYDTTIVTDTLWLTQYDTIWLYDTVVVHDTIYITQEGVDGAETTNAKIYQRDGHVVVEGVELQTVALYDAVGRVMAVKRNEGDAIRFDVPASGTYLVKVGSAPARRIVVMK